MLWRDVSHRVNVGSEVEALQVLTPRLQQRVVDVNSSSKVVDFSMSTMIEFNTKQLI